MENRSQLAPALVFAALAALAGAAHAQKVRETVLMENPSRNVGGSCIYGGDGHLLHAPRGVACPETEEPPASPAPDIAAAPARSGPTAPARSGPTAPARGGPAAHSVAPAAASDGVRSDAAALLAEREQLDVEIVRLRDAVSAEDREAARRASEQALSKIQRHLEHEARVLQILLAAAP
jgi:hypothetical protein